MKTNYEKLPTKNSPPYLILNEFKKVIIGTRSYLVRVLSLKRGVD
jgi:hypothetical protein